jgi:hypothetical protein
MRMPSTILSPDVRGGIRRRAQRTAIARGDDRLLQHLRRRARRLDVGDQPVSARVRQRQRLLERAVGVQLGVQVREVCRDRG